MSSPPSWPSLLLTGSGLRPGFAAVRTRARLWKPGEPRPEGVPQAAPGPVLLPQARLSPCGEPGGFRRRPQQLGDSVSPGEGLQGCESWPANPHPPEGGPAAVPGFECRRGLGPCLNQWLFQVTLRHCRCGKIELPVSGLCCRFRSGTSLVRHAPRDHASGRCKPLSRRETRHVRCETQKLPMLLQNPKTSGPSEHSSLPICTRACSIYLLNAINLTPGPRYS